jgi:N-acetylglucosamine kinase-like BadF-type ATPase
VNLVVDLGQSGARFKIGNAITSLGIAKNASETVVETLERIFNEIPSQNFESVFLSLTGLQGDVGNPNPYGKLCNRFFNSQQVCIMDDGIASYAGALGERSGVVLTLGGGVVAISSHEGRYGHADGKGPIFGDFGGGFWIGQYALRMAIASLDGRDSAEELVKSLREALESYRTESFVHKQFLKKVPHILQRQLNLLGRKLMQVINIYLRFQFKADSRRAIITSPSLPARSKYLSNT